MRKLDKNLLIKEITNMTIYECFKCKRLALGMTQREFAAIAEVDEGSISLFESGERINPVAFEKIKWNVENYIRALDRNKYLTTRIREETFMLQYETEEEKLHTLSHMMIHVSKLNMMYVDRVEAERD
jgi:transcriptional regulator with XRE-family HTH domain